MSTLIVIGCCISNETRKTLSEHKYKIFTNRDNTRYYLAMTWFYTTDFSFMPLPTLDIENFKLFLRINKLVDSINVYNVT